MTIYVDFFAFTERTILIILTKNRLRIVQSTDLTNGRINIKEFKGTYPFRIPSICLTRNTIRGIDDSYLNIPTI